MKQHELGVACTLALLLAACSGGDTQQAAQASAKLSDPYQAGPLTPVEIAVAQGDHGAPVRGLVFAPQATGTYPLIQFQHGFTGMVENYEFMLTRLASHGFVVFAPQMYDTGGNPANAPSIADEVTAAAGVASWLKGNVNALLDGAHADGSRFGLAGHSRGGQIAWRMLVDRGVTAQAYAGVDPVDGDAPPFSTSGPGPLVTSTPTHFGFRVHVLGSGYGSLGGPLACAPAERNYSLFENAAQDGFYGVVATDHGHADMQDPDCPQCRAECVSNPAAGMPEFSAGQLVAYFALVLGGVQDAERYLEDVSDAPVAATASQGP